MEMLKFMLMIAISAVIGFGSVYLCVRFILWIGNPEVWGVWMRALYVSGSIFVSLFTCLGIYTHIE